MEPGGNQLAESLRDGRERGLFIALEPLNRFESDLINTAEDVVKLVNDIDHPAAKIILDGFHMNIEEPDVEAAIRLAGEKSDSRAGIGKLPGYAGHRANPLGCFPNGD